MQRTLAMLLGARAQSAWPMHPPMLIALDIVLLLLICLGIANPRTRRLTAALVAAALGPVVFVLIYSLLGQSIFMERIFLPTTLLLPLLILLPLNHPWPALRYLSALAVLTIFLCEVRSVRLAWNGEHPEDSRAAMRFVQANHRDDELIVFVGEEGETLYDFYARGGDYSRRDDLVGVPRSYFALDPPRTMQRVRSDADLRPLADLLATARFSQVCLVQSHDTWNDPSHRVLNFLTDRLTVPRSREFTGIIVYHFGPVR